MTRAVRELSQAVTVGTRCVVVLETSNSSPGRHNTPDLSLHLDILHDMRPHITIAYESSPFDIIYSESAKL